MGTMGTYPADTEIVIVNSDGRPWVMRMNVPFAPKTFVAVHQDRLYIGNSEAYEIAVVSLTGELSEIIRARYVPRQLSADDVKQYKEYELAKPASDLLRQMKSVALSKMPFPDVIPAYDGLLVDLEGNLWVKESRRPGEMQPRWTVFDPRGRMLGTVATPLDFDIYEVGGDWLLGVWTDEVGVEHVRVYGIEKSAQG